MVVGQRRDAGTQPDMPRTLRRGGDEDLRRSDDLVPGGVVFTDPRLVVPEPVEVNDEVEITFQRQRRILAARMERREKDAEPLRACGSCHQVTRPHSGYRTTFGSY